MVTWDQLEKWGRDDVQELHQTTLDEEVAETLHGQLGDESE